MRLEVEVKLSRWTSLRSCSYQSYGWCCRNPCRAIQVKVRVCVGVEDKERKCLCFGERMVVEKDFTTVSGNVGN